MLLIKISDPKDMWDNYLRSSAWWYLYEVEIETISQARAVPFNRKSIRTSWGCEEYGSTMNCELMAQMKENK